MGNEIYFLNILRGLSAYYVLMSHCLIWSGWDGLKIPSPKIAVDMFMMISGFLMYSNADKRTEKEPLTDIKNWVKFWIRRFFRISPAYYLSLLIAISTQGLFLGGYKILRGLNFSKWPTGDIYDPSNISYTLKNIIYHITFIFGIFPAYSFSTFLPDWSLSLEMQYYFFFPLIYLFSKKYGFTKTFCVTWVFSFIGGKICQKALIYPEPSLILLKLHLFLYGSAIYYIVFSKKKWACKKKCLLALVVAIVLECTKNKTFNSLSLSLIMTFLAYQHHPNSGSHYLWHAIAPIINTLSKLSYSIFLFHGFFISFVAIVFSPLDSFNKSSEVRFFTLLSLVTICTFIFSAVVYRAIELPGIRLGKKMINYL